jgi:hypothetical protein
MIRSHPVVRNARNAFATATIKGAHAARPAQARIDPALAISAKVSCDETAGRPEKMTGRDRVVVVG